MTTMLTEPRGMSQTTALGLELHAEDYSLLQELCSGGPVKPLSTLARMEWDRPEAESFV